MSQYTRQQVRDSATALLRSLWRRRSNIWDPTPVTADEIFPLDIRLVAQQGLGIEFEEPEQIPPPTSISADLVPIEIAGFIDRKSNRIVVAQKFDHLYRRFTGAHEIGHWILHENLNYHRDRPLKGGERLTPKRPTAEVEADIFAAELLMPKKYVHNCFTARFTKVVRLSELDESTAYWISSPHALSRVRISDLTSKGTRYLALQVATCSAFNNRHFDSLAKRFGVSPTAAAIRLEELRLVTN